MSTPKPLVLLVGARGSTGKTIVQALTESGDFRLAALIRPASAEKPDIAQLRASGFDIRIGDLNDSVDQLIEALNGADIVISTIDAFAIPQQKNLIHAAKKVGVSRFVPCDFGTPGSKGVRDLYDSKLEIHSLIESISLPHTYIDVGWWMQLYIPVPPSPDLPPQFLAMTNSLYGTGEQKSLVTDRSHIGAWVARIIADPRTLNQAVIVWEDEVAQRDALEIGDRVSGKGELFSATRGITTREALEQIATDAAAALAANPQDFSSHIQRTWAQYMISLHFLGENTLENAKRLGYLDAREMYPDRPRHTLEDFAKEFYAVEDPGSVYKREQ